MKTRVSDAIVHYLVERQKTTHVFLLSGGGMMHLLDAAGRNSHLQVICHHHEQAAAMAAEGYARLGEKLGVCFLTSGPGGTNAITGIAGAWQDSSPVLFITGQSKSSQTIQNSGINGLRQFGVFEVDIVPLVTHITKLAIQLREPRRVRYEVERACWLAQSGRPGPVLLDIPLDIQSAEVEWEKLESFIPPSESQLQRIAPLRSRIDQALLRLLEAKRPLVLAGHGIRCAGQLTVESLKNWIERLEIPIVTTLLAKDLFAYDHPLWIGHPGSKGDRAGNFSIQNADVILSLGQSFHLLTTGWETSLFAPNAYMIEVEVDPSVSARTARAGVQVGETLPILVQDFITAAAPVPLSHRSDTTLSSQQKWLKTCQAWKLKYPVRNEPHRRVPNEIQYYDFVETLSELASPDDTIITDAGSAYYLIGQAFRTRAGQRVISSGALGAMGFAMPASTGAAFARPGARVLCVTGDGSAQTNLQELSCYVQHHIPVKLFIINNDGYVSIRNTQNSFFSGHQVGTDTASGVHFPSLEKISTAYSISYVALRSPKSLATDLAQALSSEGPALIEVFCSRDLQIMPSVGTKRLPDGSLVSQALDEMNPQLESPSRESIP